MYLRKCWRTKSLKVEDLFETLGKIHLSDGYGESTICEKEIPENGTWYLDFIFDIKTSSLKNLENLIGEITCRTCHEYLFRQIEEEKFKREGM